MGFGKEGGVTSGPGLNRAGTPDFGSFKFQSPFCSVFSSPLVPIQKRVIMEICWRVVLFLALFILRLGVEGCQAS